MPMLDSGDEDAHRTDASRCTKDPAGGHAALVGADDLPARKLLQVARALASDLDMPAILDRVLEAARDLTGARYAAIGVLDDRRRGLARFFTRGVDVEAYHAIGELPSGEGVLGALIADPRPLRLREVGEHPLSYGMPTGHPEMHSFLGVPVMIRGQAWGNLYLTEKQGAPEFSDADEEAAVILAEWAGAAIENASLYERSERRREQLEQAVQGLEATRDIAVAIGGATALPHVLELIAKRGRALVQARSLLILLREGNDLVVAASAGYAEGVYPVRLPITASSSGEVLRSGPRRISDVPSELQISPALLGIADARTALLMPMPYGGESIGVLAAFDRGVQAKPFTDADEQLLHTFAASAANAVASAHTVQADRLRSAIAAAEAERRHWGRELHDETLQILGSLRILLAGTLRAADHRHYEQAMRHAVRDVELGIDGLRAIIADLRPAALDRLGLAPALEALLERRRADGLRISADLQLPHDAQLDPDLQTTVYRLVQEALTNVLKHARASSVRAVVAAAGGRVSVEIADDGVGFDAHGRHDGFGLSGMRERVELAGGRLQIRSDERGTLLCAWLPSQEAPATAGS